VGYEIIKADLTLSAAEFNMPSDNTDFVDNGVGIDPADCRCTDCIVGNSIPFNESNANKLAILAFQAKYQGRKIHSRLGSGVTVIPYSRGFDFGIVSHDSSLEN
jgi:hypothetical protein